MTEEGTTKAGKKQADAVDKAQSELELVEEKLAAARLRLSEVEAGANASHRKAGKQDSDACQAKTGNIEQQNPNRVPPKVEKAATA